MIAAPFEKTYLSRAQSRLWSMDNPVGDPFGGPAYGEKREPVSMIAAIVSIGVGASAVGAAVTAGALTLSAVMGGLMIAGGAASLIGTVSGNKQLTMIGGIVAGVGGLGLGAANLFADAAATTSLASAEGDMLAQGVANANATAGGAAPYGVGAEAAYANPANLAPAAGGVDTGNLVSMPSIGSFEPTSASFDLNSTLNGGSQAAAGGAAPYGTGVEANYSNPGLINSAAGEALGSAADLGGSVVQTATVDPVAYSDMLVGNAGSDVLAGSPGNDLLNDPMKFGGDYGVTKNTGEVFDSAGNLIGKAPGFEEQVRLAANGDYGVTKNTGAVFDSAGNYMGQAPGFEEVGKNTVLGAAQRTGGSESGSWLDKIEGIASGIEKYKTTALLGSNMVSGAMKYAIPSQTDQAAIDLYNAKANLANQEASAISALEERKRRYRETVANLKAPSLYTPSVNPAFAGAVNGAGIINSAKA